MEGRLSPQLSPLTAAGVTEQLSSGAPLLGEGGGQRQTPGLSLRVADLPLQVALGDLRHRVKEDQLPLPPPLPPGLLLGRRLALDREESEKSAGQTSSPQVKVR